MDPLDPERTDTGTHNLLAVRRQRLCTAEATKLHTLVFVTSLFTLLFSFSLLFFHLAVLYRNFCWGTRSSYDVNDAQCLLRVFTHGPQLDKAAICLVYVLLHRPQAALLGPRMKNKNWKNVYDMGPLNLVLHIFSVRPLSLLNVTSCRGLNVTHFITDD